MFKKKTGAQKAGKKLQKGAAKKAKVTTSTKDKVRSKINPNLKAYSDRNKGISYK